MINLKTNSHVTATPNFHFFAFIKFGLVGFMTAAIYFLVMWSLDTIFGVQYTVAVSLAYILSTVFQFLANRHFTFVAAHGQHEIQFAKYVLVWLINYLITILVVKLFFETLHLSPYIGVCVSVLFTMCIGYILGRFWVFNVIEVTK